MKIHHSTTRNNRKSNDPPEEINDWAMVLLIKGDQPMIKECESWKSSLC